MSNYLAQGLQQGFSMGSQVVSDMKRRKFEEEQEKLRREREIEREAKQERLAREMQTERITADATKFFSGQEFTGRENALNRGHQTSERIGSQEYGSGETDKKLKAGSTESALEREARQRALDRQLDQDMFKFNQELPLRGAQVGTQMRAQAWTENPANPLNLYRSSHVQDNNPVEFNGGAPSPFGRNPAARQPSPEAIEALRKEPSRAAEFDAKYGSGSAARWLR